MNSKSLQDLKWGTWNFSVGAQELLNNFLTETNKIDSSYSEQDLMKWKALLLYSQEKRQKNEREDAEESFESSSEDLDECEEWEEVKKFTKFKTPEIDFSLYNEFHTEEAVQEEILFKADDQEDLLSQFDTSLNLQKVEVKKGKDEKDAANIGVATLLFQTLRNEEPDVSQVCRLLSSGISKENLGILWNKLESENASRICLVSALSLMNLHVEFVCKSLLQPWFTEMRINELRDVIEKMSDCIPRFSEVAIKNLVLPLVNSESGAFIKDLELLKDLMAHVGGQQWALLFHEFVSNIKGNLEIWYLPLLSLLLESVKDCTVSNASMTRLLHLMHACSSEFAQDRDFGGLILAAIKGSVKFDCSQTYLREMKNISENYRGPLRFKVMNLIKKSAS